MSPGEIETMIACGGGQPLVAIADVAKVAADLIRYPGILRVGLQGIVHPVSGDNLVLIVFTVVEI